MKAGIRGLLTAVLLAAVLGSPEESRGCTGDCNGDGRVAISDLVVGVNIALGMAPVVDCGVLDTDDNGQISIGELVRAVNNALRGCPTPTNTQTTIPTDTPSPTITPTPAPLDYECQLIESGFGAEGSVEIAVEVAVDGLEVPWGIAFLPDGAWLVTERPGRVRRVTPDRLLVPEPVLTLDVARVGEGGLLGIALHPEFATNRFFYLYSTIDEGGSLKNRVERYRLAPDARLAMLDRVILDDIRGASFHDGGRLRFGPDRHLYVTVGDARQPDLAQDPAALAGKVLRIDAEGGVPSDNPFPGSAAYVIGVRNSQGIDWRDDGRLVLVDHGPSGEFGRQGLDEINVAEAGTNLGWPEVSGCDAAAGLAPPSMVWRQAMPPGGVAIYRGDEIPEWRGDALIGVLGFRGLIGHLHRIRLAPNGQTIISEVYLSGANGFGRLREVIMGPDGGLYVTTSNCDGRATCPARGDVILRIGRSP